MCFPHANKTKLGEVGAMKGRFHTLFQRFVSSFMTLAKIYYVQGGQDESELESEKSRKSASGNIRIFTPKVGRTAWLDIVDVV